MLMKIVWGRVKPGTWGKYEETYNRLLSTTAGDVPGLKHRMLARSVQDPDEGYLISFWDSKEEITAYKESTVFKEAILELDECFEGTWWEKLYELRSGLYSRLTLAAS